MKKYGLRILVGLIAFGTGLGAVGWMFKLSKEKSYSSTVKVQNNYPNSFVTIKYKGFKEQENRLISAEFEVTNNSPMTMYYRSRHKESHEHNQVSVNDKEGIRLGYCGNVAMQMKEFPIEPSETKTFEIGFYRFRDFSVKEKNQNVKVGYDFKFGEFDNYKTFWSEDFQLPKIVKEEIMKYK